MIVVTHLIILLLTVGCNGQRFQSLCCDELGEVKPFKDLMTNRSLWHTNEPMLTPVSTCLIASSINEPAAEHKNKLIRCENVTLEVVNMYMNQINERGDNDGRRKSSSNKAFNGIHLSDIYLNRNDLKSPFLEGGRYKNTDSEYAKLVQLDENTTEYLSWIKSNLTAEDIDVVFGNDDELFNKMIVLHLEDNQINRISQKLLAKVPHLVTLNLSGNEVENDLLEKNLFQRLPKLTQLDLSRNKLTAILVQNNETTTNNRRMCTYTECTIFGNLMQLKYLDLSHNNITDLPRNAFDGLNALTCLNLAFNSLFVTPFQAFHALKNLEQMDLSHNHLVSVLDNFFNGNRELKILLLQHNAIEKLSQYSFFGLRKLRHLDVSFNHLLTIDRNAFDSLIALESLNLSGNKFKLIPTMLFGSLKQLQSLDLSENIFTVLPNGVFASQYNLENLTIDDTAIEKLGNFISRQASVVNKDILVNLRHVSIRNNQHLCEIDPMCFHSTPAVEHLDLSGNRLTTIPADIVELKNLTSLDISRNDLINIPKQLNELGLLKSLNLLGNSFDCDCHMHWLSDWIENLEKELGSDADVMPLNHLNRLKCRHGYPGDMLRVLQLLHCMRPMIKHVSESKTHLLRSEAQLECTFNGSPAPDVIWVTPTNKIIRHHADPDTKPVFMSESKRDDDGDGPHVKSLKQRGNIDYQKLQEHSADFTIHENIMGFSLLENGSLRIHNISRKDSGLYTCYGYNIMGYSTANIR